MPGGSFTSYSNRPSRARVFCDTLLTRTAPQYHHLRSSKGLRGAGSRSAVPLRFPSVIFEYGGFIQ